MKIKNINFAFFILSSLILSSFAFYVGAENTTTKSIFLDSDQDGLSDEEEKIYGTNPANPDTDGDGYSDGTEVRSGYDPLKKAPGDKLIQTPASNAISAPVNAENISDVLGDSSEKNLTEDVAQKLAELTDKSNADGKPISLDDLQATIDQAMSPSIISESDLPEIDESAIKIKKQNYSKLSEEKAKAKKKEDFLDYIAAVTYIFTSNSPKPITSITDASGMLSNITSIITTAITTQSASGLKDLVASQKKIVEQLMAVEVPEDFLAIHKKALRFALYTANIGTLFQSKGDDPMGDIANLSKLQGFITIFSDFATEAQSKIAEYGLTYDETVQNKLKSYGINAPKDLSELEALQTTNTTATTTTETTTP
ncbi:MAG: hypothetical protein WCK16_00635 [Candidatus Moraniibacteriota bacterium]